MENREILLLTMPLLQKLIQAMDGLELEYLKQRLKILFLARPKRCSLFLRFKPLKSICFRLFFHVMDNKKSNLKEILNNLHSITSISAPNQPSTLKKLLENLIRSSIHHPQYCLESLLKNAFEQINQVTIYPQASEQGKFKASEGRNFRIKSYLLDSLDLITKKKIRQPRLIFPRDYLGSAPSLMDQQTFFEVILDKVKQKQNFAQYIELIDRATEYLLLLLNKIKELLEHQVNTKLEIEIWPHRRNFLFRKRDTEGYEGVVFVDGNHLVSFAFQNSLTREKLFNYTPFQNQIRTQLFDILRYDQIDNELLIVEASDRSKYQQQLRALLNYDQMEHVAKFAIRPKVYPLLHLEGCVQECEDRIVEHQVREGKCSKCSRTVQDMSELIMDTNVYKVYRRVQGLLTLIRSRGREDLYLDEAEFILRNKSESQDYSEVECWFEEEQFIRCPINFILNDLLQGLKDEAQELEKTDEEVDMEIFKWLETSAAYELQDAAQHVAGSEIPQYFEAPSPQKLQ